MDCSLPGSSVHGILQARILEWVAMPFSRGSSQPRDRTWVSHTTGGFFTVWATNYFTTYYPRNQKSLFALLLLFSSSVLHYLPEFARLMSIELVMLSNHLIICHPLLLCIQSFPASGSFLTSQLFASGGQSIGASASASVFPMNIQSWFPLGLTGCNFFLYLCLQV